MLGALQEIPEGASKGYTIPAGARDREIFLVRRGEAVYGYENSCPHTGVTLNWKPDEFLSFDRMYIQCSVHGAQFRIGDGVCVYGPCVGQSLRRVAVEIVDGMIEIEAGEPEAPIRVRRPMPG